MAQSVTATVHATDSMTDWQTVVLNMAQSVTADSWRFTGHLHIGPLMSRSQSRGKLVSDDTEIGTFIGDIEYAALTHLSARVKASAILHFIALFKLFFSTEASARRTRK